MGLLRMLLLFALVGCNSFFSFESKGVLFNGLVNQTTSENKNRSFSFSISGSPVSSTLCSGSALTITSSDVSVLPTSGISFSGSNSNCSVTLEPALNMQGTSLVTFAYTYDGKNSSKSFNLTVTTALPLFEIDTTFGTSGEITIPRPFVSNLGGFEFDGSGNILFATSTYNLADTKIDRAFLSRYSVSLDGLDLTFNGSGSRELDMGGSYDWGGQILVEDFGKFSHILLSEDALGEWKIDMARFNADGTPDASFGTSGIVNLNVCGVYCLARKFLKINNKYYVSAYDGSSRESMVLLRLNNDGTLDATFPYIRIDPSVGAQNIEGADMVYDGTHVYLLHKTDFQFEPTNSLNYYLCKFDLDGNAIPAFGTGGCFKLEGTNTARSIAGNLILSEDGSSLFLAGRKNDQPFITKIDPQTGVVDATFGTAGDVFYNDVTNIVEIKEHSELGLIILSKVDTLVPKTFVLDVLQLDGTPWPQNNLSTRYTGLIDPINDVVGEGFKIYNSDLYVATTVLAPVEATIFQKLKINP